MRSSSLFLSIFCLLGLIGCAGYAPDPSLSRPSASDKYNEIGYNSEPAPVAAPRATASFEEDSPAISKPTFMVMPAKDQNDLVSSLISVTITKYLTQKAYEVKSIEDATSVDNIVKMQNDIAGTEDDLFYLTSIALGADICFKYYGHANVDDVIVEVKAFETSTGKLLGSHSAEVKHNGHIDEANLRAHIQSATKKAMGSIEKNLESYWKETLEKGSQYKVVMNIKQDLDDSQIEDLHDVVLKTLKTSFNQVIVSTMTSQTIDVIVFADVEKYTDANDVYSTIRNKLKDVTESKKLSITKKLIIMDLQ